jgi:hypothetical protein
MKRLLNIKRYFTIVIFSLILLSSFSQIVSSEDDVEVENILIYVPSSEPKIKYGLPVWIQGLWQYVNITLNDFSNEISLIFHHGDTPADDEDRDETNFYIWEYSYGNWEDTFHSNNYIKQDLCGYLNNTYSFHIGIDQWTIKGNWTLRFYSEDGQQIHYEEIYVDNAIVDPEVKTTPVEIMVEPFSDDFYISEWNFTVANRGNVPLDVSVGYGRYSDLFQTLYFEDLFKPGDERYFGIKVHSRSTWPPGVLEINGEAKVIADALPYIIPSKRVVNIIESTVEIGFTIILKIGRFDLTLQSLGGDIYFQYEKEKDIYYDEIGEIFAYLSGNGKINIDIRSENLEIIGVYSGGAEVGTRFSINPTNDSEYPISISVKGLKPKSTGKIYYDLETGGVHNSFFTTINVRSIRPSDIIGDDTATIIEIAIIVCIALVLVYMIFTQMRHKKKKK